MTAVHWATEYPDATGHVLGYATHNDRMKAALAATGVTFDESAPVAVHVCPPHLFTPIKGKRSIVSCAWEAVEMPEAFKVLKYAAAVCPTATFLLDPLRKLLPGKRLEHLPLGVDVDRFTFADRLSPHRKPLTMRTTAKPGGRPFRFLWVGAPNARKGGMHCMEAWKAKDRMRRPIFEGNPAFELYYKSTMSPGDPVGDVRVIGNVTYDTRRLPRSELAKLYQSAHAFLFPTAGEGFGLTLAEAMATGLPSIYTPCTAMWDIAPTERRLGFPLKFSVIERDWEEPTRPEVNVRVKLANPDTTDLANRMIEVVNDYAAAVARGRAASQWIRGFNWERSGSILRRIVDELYEGAYASEANVQAA